jgi:4-carboxymuconolactone decarboxylase
MPQPKARLNPPARESYTPEQKKAAADFEALRKEPPFGPFGLLLHSPEVMTRAQQLGEYLRYRTSIGHKLQELAVLVTARECSQDYEWFLHQPIAVKAGVNQEIADAIRDGRRPEGMSDDEALVYDVSIALQRTKNIPDSLYDRALKRFGPQGLVDLIATNGYYALLAMQLNAHRMPLPEGAAGLPKLG